MTTSTVRYTITLRGTAVRVIVQARSAIHAWRQYQVLWRGVTKPARKSYSIVREVAP
jgi:hypothetical protein